MTRYFIKTEGNENNFFQDVTCEYSYSQYTELIKYFTENGIEFTNWTFDN